MFVNNEDLHEFQKREESTYCKHSYAVRCLRKSISNNSNEDSAEVISTSPFAAVVDAGSSSYGVIVAGHRDFKCVTCIQPKCSHMEVFAQWNEEETAESSTEEGMDAMRKAFSEIKLSRTKRIKSFSCLSTKPIPWPVNKQYRNRKSEIDRRGFPSILKPKSAASVCSHGAKYKLSLVTDKAVIHRESNMKLVKLYAYQTQGCSCTVTYDGQDDLLLNLNNKDLFDLDWLFSILDRANYSVCPLMTAFTTSQLARKRCADQSKRSALTYHRLRDAYNCFIRYVNFPII
jgi:hypothetical protein